MKIISGFKEMLGSDGQWSSKRVITFLAFLLVATAFIANLGWGIVVSESMFSGVIEIVWAGLAVTVGEHILKVKNGVESKNKN